MENPYHHPKQKKHAIDLDDVRRLVFEAFNIVRTSTSMVGAGLEADLEAGVYNEEDKVAPTSIEKLHYGLAEQELSSKLLRIAMLMRTLDDYWSEFGHTRYTEAVAKVESLGWGDWDKGPTFREALNKIIHAQDVRPVYGTDDSREADARRWGMNGELKLRGTRRKHEWTVTLNLNQFFDAVVDILNVVDDLAPDSAAD